MDKTLIRQGLSDVATLLQAHLGSQTITSFLQVLNSFHTMFNEVYFFLHIFSILPPGRIFSFFLSYFSLCLNLYDGILGVNFRPPFYLLESQFLEIIYSFQTQLFCLQPALILYFSPFPIHLHSLTKSDIFTMISTEVRRQP